MGTFRNKWDTIVESIKDKLSDETLADQLASKVEQSADLRDDMAYYHRIPVNHEDHSYRYLREAVDRCLFREQQKKNREEHSCAISQPAGDRGRESHDRSANPAQNSSAKPGKNC